MPGINLPFHHKAKISSDQKDEGWYETGLVQRAGSEPRCSEILRAAHMKVLEAELGKLRTRTGQVTARALVDGRIVCEAELMFALVE